jgi:hypothetical protein
MFASPHAKFASKGSIRRMQMRRARMKASERGEEGKKKVESDVVFFLTLSWLESIPSLAAMNVFGSDVQSN